MKRIISLVMAFIIIVATFGLPINIINVGAEPVLKYAGKQWGVLNYADKISISGEGISLNQSNRSITADGNSNGFYNFGDLSLQSDTYLLSTTVSFNEETQYDWQGVRITFAGDSASDYLCLAFFRNQLHVFDMQNGSPSDRFFGSVYPTYNFERTLNKEYKVKIYVSGNKFSIWLDDEIIFENISMPQYTGGNIYGMDFCNSVAVVSSVSLLDYSNGAFFAERATLRYTPYSNSVNSEDLMQAIRMYFCLNADNDGKIAVDGNIYGVEKYGAIIAKETDSLKDDGLTLESPCAKLYGSSPLSELAVSGEYTAHLYDIPSLNSKVGYIFRPFVNVKDKNGNSTVLYGESATVSVDDVYNYFLYEEVLEQTSLDRMKQGFDMWSDGVSTTQLDRAYVSVNGNNSGSGSVESPYRTLSKAIEQVKNNGEIVILDTAYVSGWLEHSKTVTISGGSINFVSDKINLGDNVTFAGTALNGVPTVVYKRGYVWNDNNISSSSNVSVVSEGGLSEEEISANSLLPIDDVYHDQGYIYMTPLEPTGSDEITLRIRTKKGNVTSAKVQYTKDNGTNWTEADMTAVDLDETGYYDYYEVILPPQSDVFTYRFLCRNSRYSSYVIIDSVGSNGGVDTDWFVIAPDMKTPDWAKGALVYYLIPGSFYNGTVTNDYGTSGEITELAYGEELSDISRYGGDLKGMQEKMPYISDEMKADALYFTPVWKSNNGMGYGASDLNQVDSIYGNEQDLSDTIAIAHKNGLKVILDSVINYASLDNIWFNKNGMNPLEGAYQSKTSPFYSYFKFNSWPNDFVNQWGGASLDFSKSNVQALMYKGKTSYLRRHLTGDYNADGWRMDAGGDIWGSSADTYEILKEIRPYIKETKTDALFLSENGYYKHMRNRSVDARWNMDFMYEIRSWIAGDGRVDQNALAYFAIRNICQMPRQTALCSANYYENHDFERMYDGTVESKIKIMAARLFIMNYVGSPMIYYGAENGAVSKNSRWDSFNWNESLWDRDFYALQKALGELHSEYSALKTGVFKNLKVDNANLLYAFGRWDENGAVLTVTNQKNSTQQTELDVKSMSISNGTVLTDYLTGCEYTVQNGKIIADIIPGGTAFVTGKAGGYRSKYALTDGTASVKQIDKNTFALSDCGMLGGLLDTASFALTPIYGETGIAAYVETDQDGTAVLAIRESEKDSSAEYILKVNKNSSTVYYRENTLGALRKLSTSFMGSGKYYKIQRQPNNVLCVFTSSDGTVWNKLEGSEKTLDFDNKVYAGFTCTSGKVTLSNVNTIETAKLYDSFESGEIKGSFTKFGSVVEADVEANKLVLTTGGRIGGLVMPTPTEGNWTAKTEISPLKNSTRVGSAGLVSMNSETDYVTAGRCVINKRPMVYIAKYSGGKQVLLYTSADTKPDKNVQLQLQCIGTRYTAVYRYSTSEKWKNIGNTDIFASYSTVEVGLISSLQGAAKFEYFTFGDSINDGASIYTPANSNANGLKLDKLNSIIETTKLSVGTGHWNYDIGGIANSSTSGLSRLDASKLFSDFRADFTVKTKYGDGYAGLAFSQTTAGGMDGFFVKLYKNGKLEITNKETVLAETMLSNEENTYGRIVVERVGKKLNVYAGKELKAVITITVSALKDGYVSYLANDEMITLCNYNLYDLNADWSLRYAYAHADNDKITVVQKSYQEEAELVPLGMAQTEFDFTTLVNVTAVADEIGYSGVCFENNALKNGASKIKVILTTDGNLKVLLDDMVASVMSVQKDTVKIRVTAQNNIYSVFVDDNTTPIYSVQTDLRTGTTPRFITNYASAQFSAIAFSQLY